MGKVSCGVVAKDMPSLTAFPKLRINLHRQLEGGGPEVLALRACNHSQQRRRRAEPSGIRVCLPCQARLGWVGGRQIVLRESQLPPPHLRAPA